MAHAPDFKMVAEQLVQIARWASRMGWAPATSTNYSVRLSADAVPAYCAITSSGVDKGAIEVEHILAIDQHGSAIHAGGLTLQLKPLSICFSTARWEPEPCFTRTRSQQRCSLTWLAMKDKYSSLGGNC